MTREEIKDLLKFIIRKCDIIINNKNYKADDFVQDKVEDIAEMCHMVLDGKFGEIVTNPDVADEPFVIVTNTENGKWFRAKKCIETMTIHTSRSVDITFNVTPNDIKDTIPVIGEPCLPDWIFLPKEECKGNIKELHIEVFNKDKIKQEEYFLYDAWVERVNYETTEIVFTCDCVK